MDDQAALSRILLEDQGGHMLVALCLAALHRVPDIIDGIAHMMRMIIHLMTERDAALRQSVRVPVDCLTGIVCPDAVEALIAIAVALPIHFGDDAKLVGVVAVGKLLAAANGCYRVTDAASAIVFSKLLDKDGFCSLLHG